MRKLQNFKLFVYVGVIVVIMVFVGINLLEAKRPPKETANWGVWLPSYNESGGLNLYGMGMEGNPYWNDNDSISVYVRKDRSKHGVLYYQIRLFIYQNAEGPWAGFREVDIDDDCVTGDGTPCGLPDPYSGPLASPPGCIEDFLNEEQHPVAGYEHLMIMFYIFEDIEAMQPGQEIPLYDRSWGRFFVWNMFNCDDPDIEPPHFYHTIIGTFHNPTFDEINGFFIKRNDKNSWTISYRNSDVSIKESYCEKELGYTGKGNKKRPYYIDKLYTPVVGTTAFAFEFDLLKKTN